LVVCGELTISDRGSCLITQCPIGDDVNLCKYYSNNVKQYY